MLRWASKLNWTGLRQWQSITPRYGLINIPYFEASRVTMMSNNKIVQLVKSDKSRNSNFKYQPAQWQRWAHHCIRKEQSWWLLLPFSLLYWFCLQKHWSVITYASSQGYLRGDRGRSHFRVERSLWGSCWGLFHLGQSSQGVLSQTFIGSSLLKYL